MLNTNVFQFPGCRKVVAEHEFLNPSSLDTLPEIPTLPETLLAMELQSQEFSFDLRAISEVILDDPGATLQILRLAGREYPDAEGRPLRIEDCISDLGFGACVSAVEKGTLPPFPNSREVATIWEHSRRFAHLARAVAEALPGSVRPGEAYLGGLLHNIGVVPAVLGWQGSIAASHPALAALQMAERWALPSFVKDLFCEMWMPGYDPRWAAIMEVTRRLDESSRCRMCDLARLSLTGEA